MKLEEGNITYKMTLLKAVTAPTGDQIVGCGPKVIKVCVSITIYYRHGRCIN